MTIDKQIQKLKKENSTQDAANLRYLTNFYLFDYIVSISIYRINYVVEIYVCSLLEREFPQFCFCSS